MGLNKKNLLETKYDFKIVGDVLKMLYFKMVGYKVIREYVECGEIKGGLVGVEVSRTKTLNIAMTPIEQ